MCWFYELSSQIFGGKQDYTKLSVVSLLKNGNNEMQINDSCRIAKFKHSLWRSLWNAWKIPFTALWKLGFITEEYGWKSELCNYVQWKSGILNFSIIYRTVLGICKLGFITDQSGWISQFLHKFWRKSLI